MHLPLLLLSLLPAAFAQTTTASAATSTSTTIVDFSALPSCATSCGPLYDAQGACTPTNVPVSNLQTYETCFCAYSTLQPFLTGTSGVCDYACTSDSTGLSEIQSWFLNLCGDATSTSSSATSSAISTTTASASTSRKYVNHNSGSAWVTYHWKWIIMVVVLVVSIVGIWVAACIFRKRHLAKKEKEYELTHPVPLGPDGKPNYAATYPPNAAEAGQVPPIDTQPGMKEKGKGKAKWIVKERT